jgi:uncharacterized membrane protein YkoI
MMRRYGVLMGCMVAAILLLAGAVRAAEEVAAEGKTEAKEEAKVELPSAAAEAVKAAFPKAKIEEVELEKECGLDIYEVELKLEDESEVEVEIAPDGTIVEIETEIAMKDVPVPAAEAVQAADPDAKIEEVKKIEIRAVIKKTLADWPAPLVKLDKAKIVYEAELKKGDKEGEITVAADGKVVEPLKWKDKEKGEKEEKGEHEKKGE